MTLKLDRDTWIRLAQYLDAVLDIPPEQRAAWIAQLALEKPEIAATLRAVLAGGEQMEAQGFLETMQADLPPVASLAGQQVGPYTIESLIGRGGMSEVWLAQRSDGRFSGRVALKFLDSSLVNASVLERFRREGKLLARLTHPHIARLIDAGVTSGGRPYLVLEHVEGVGIDQFCEARGLGIDARLRLFLDVLAAVAHAHVNLIVHRDIKPSNVLVTQSGEVKLLDFGIAKLLGRDPSDEDYSAPTRIEDVALTPAYAAPEQILGDLPSTATDVYQLGVLLHLLLTGHLPFESSGVTRSQRVRAALEDEPSRPSDVAAAGLRKALRGDIDAIVAKALRKRADERYASAAALSNDLHRYLNHEPVSARERALAYRMKKFIRRYRGVVLGTAAAALALILSTAFALIQMRDAQAQRDAARFQQKRAEAESQFMTLMMSTVGSGDRPVTPAQILANGMTLLDRQYARDPQFRYTMLVRMAARLMDLGATDQEYDALLKAEKIARQLDDPERIAMVECDAVEPEIAFGHPDRAAARLGEAQQALARAHNAALSTRVECLDAEASLLEAQGDEPAAIKTAEHAVALLAGAGETRDVQYTDLLSHVAQMYWDSGNVKKAFEVHQLDGTMLMRNGQGATESALSIEHDIAGELMEFGEIRSAFEREREVLSRQKSASSDGTVIPAITTTYGTLELRLDQPAAALQSFNASLAMARHTGDLTSELFARIGRARALLAQGTLADAENELDEVARLARGRETAMRRALTRAQIVRAETLMARERFEEAGNEIGAVLGKLRSNSVTGEAPYLGSAMLIASRIASRIAKAEGQRAEAEGKTAEALAFFEQRARKPELSADVGEALLLLAEERRDRGDRDGMREAARRAVVSLTAGLGADHTLTHEAAAML